MGRRTDPQILVDHLRDQPRNSASPTRLSALTGWPADKVERAIQRGVKDPYLALHIGRGGTVQYRGEEASAQPGIYSDVAESSRVTGVLVNWDFVMTVAFSARGGSRGWGTWTHPDLVVSADPRRRRSRSEPPRLHAIEVETAEGLISSRLPGTRPGRAQTTAGSLGHSLQGSQIMNGIGPYGLRRNSVLASSSSRDLGRLEHGGPIFTQSSRLPRENSGASSLRSHCAKTSRSS